MAVNRAFDIEQDTLANDSFYPRQAPTSPNPAGGAPGGRANGHYDNPLWLGVHAGGLKPVPGDAPQEAQSPSLAPTTSWLVPAGSITGTGALGPFEEPMRAPDVTENRPLEREKELKESPTKERSARSVSFSMDTDLESISEEGEDEEEKKELSNKQKALKVVFLIARLLCIIGCLYFFICSLNLLSSAFILIGGRMADDAFGKNPLLSNPICGLMLGVVSTAFLQSSSTSTSIVVTMVASNILTVPLAIPIIMGSNIGTSVTGILVAVTQAGDRRNFRRAFSAATVHDMFNWLTVITLLPLEVATGYLYHLTSAIVAGVNQEGGGSKTQFLSAIVKPFTDLIVQVDKDALEKIAAGAPGSDKIPLLKQWCEKKSVPANSTEQPVVQSRTTVAYVMQFSPTASALTPSPTKTIGVTPCRYLFHGTSLSEPVVGVIVLLLALFMLVACLIIMVKVLKSLLAGPMAKVIRVAINADFPGRAAPLTGYAVLLVGALCTVLVQSSSVVASALTPLVGLGIVTVERVFPMMLGANIGTTSTAILAAFAASEKRFKASFQISMCHLFFNLTGILIWFPLPFMRAVPIRLAKFLGKTTARYRWFAVLYIIVMFFLLPMIIFGLSIPGWPVLVGVGVPFLLLLIAIGLLNLLQRRRPQWLPEKLRSWDFLPEWMRSLAPADRLISRLMTSCLCCKCCERFSSPSSEEVVGEEAGAGQEEDKRCDSKGSSSKGKAHKLSSESRESSSGDLNRSPGEKEGGIRNRSFCPEEDMLNSNNISLQQQYLPMKYESSV